jgi:hypothetical protein
MSKLILVAGGNFPDKDGFFFDIQVCFFIILKDKKNANLTIVSR